MDALTYVSHSVERVATSSAQTFVRGFRDFDEMGLCPICQDGFEFGRYGVLACGHIMHIDFWVLYEAYERGRRHLTAYQSVPFAMLGFGGCGCICV